VAEELLPDWVTKEGSEWRFKVTQGTLVLKQGNWPALKLLTREGVVATGNFGFFSIYRISGVVQGDCKYVLTATSCTEEECVFRAGPADEAGGFPVDLRVTIRRDGSVEYDAGQATPPGTYAISNTAGAAYYARDTDLRPSAAAEPRPVVRPTRFMVVECDNGLVYSLELDRPVACRVAGQAAWTGSWKHVRLHWAEDFDDEFDRLLSATRAISVSGGTTGSPNH
jgi:hypothetical protein